MANTKNSPKKKGGISKKSKKSSNKKTLFIICAVIIIVVAVGVVYFCFPDVWDSYMSKLTSDSETVSQEEPKSSDSEKKVSSLAGKMEDIDLNHCVKVHFIDVGQGDSILIELDGGETIMLIDAGSGTFYYKSVPKTVTEPYFSYLDEVIGEGDIDYFVSTHSDADHINMMPKVLETYQINTIYVNDCYNENVKDASKTLEEFETKCEEEPNCDLHEYSTENDTIEYINGENYTITIYSSGNDGFKGAESKDNSMSIICLLEYGGRKVLFTGDAEEKTEEWFISKVGDIDVDVLKVGHHGSRSSSSKDFLDAIDAEYAVISAGEGNDYGHPHQETLDRLNERNITTYNTMDNGTIVLYIDAEGDYCFVTETKE